jgi:hypothetical protein
MRLLAAARSVAVAASGRRGLQACLGAAWLLDAGLQLQPYMFGPFFVTQVIAPSADGDPGLVAASVNWAAHLMLAHIAVYNAIFAMIQLLIGAGLLLRRTLKIALAASIAWSLSVWWFGEGLGGIFTGASPLAGVPGGVVLYALIAVLLWPVERAPARGAPEASAAAGAGLLRPRWANLLWLTLWGSYAYFLLLPDNRDPASMADTFASTDGQPGWLVAIMNRMSVLAGHYGSAIAIGLAVCCALVAVCVLARPATKPGLVLAAAAALFFWLAEGLGGIFTGQGTDPSTGPLLVLLAACYWPPRDGAVDNGAAGEDRRGQASAGPGGEPVAEATALGAKEARAAPNLIFVDDGRRVAVADAVLVGKPVSAFLASQERGA